MPRTKIDNGLVLEEAFHRRIRDAITPERIRNFSRKICIGDEIVMETAKGCDIEGGVNNKRPIKRRATIARIYPHFVLVRLENGQMESVLWKDMMELMKGGRC